MCSQEDHQDDKFGPGKETSYFPNAVCNRVVSLFSEKSETCMWAACLSCKFQHE